MQREAFYAPIAPKAHTRVCTRIAREWVNDADCNGVAPRQGDVRQRYGFSSLLKSSSDIEVVVELSPGKEGGGFSCNNGKAAGSGQDTQRHVAPTSGTRSICDTQSSMITNAPFFEVSARLRMSL